VQLLGALTVSPGRIADVDDLIGNTVGAMIGCAAFTLLALVPAPASRPARLALRRRARSADVRPVAVAPPGRARHLSVAAVLVLSARAA
jgi:hypothetical protein